MKKGTVKWFNAEKGFGLDVYKRQGLFGSVINSDNSMLSVHNADCFLIPCRLLYIIINNN